MKLKMTVGIISLLVISISFGNILSAQVVDDMYLDHPIMNSECPTLYEIWMYPPIPEDDDPNLLDILDANNDSVIDLQDGGLAIIIVNELIEQGIVEVACTLAAPTPTPTP